jgi:nicotinamide riboside transporter PnuC
MPDNRWIDTTQPQTLLIAVILLYLNAAFALLSILTGAISLVALATFLGVAAGYGISNEKKWGYGLGIVVAVIGLAVLVLSNPFAGANLISLMFAIALVALLLHPQSREYQRIWFK